MCYIRMSESRRQSDSSSSAASTSTTSSAAVTSHVLTIPSNNTLLFAPQRHSPGPASTAHAPLAFMTPSGQIFLTAPFPPSPAMPLSFLNSPNLLPQIPTAIPSTVFSVPSLSMRSGYSFLQDVSQNPLRVVSSTPLQSPEITHTSSHSSPLVSSSTTASSLRQPISQSLSSVAPLSSSLVSGKTRLRRESVSLPPSPTQQAEIHHKEPPPISQKQDHGQDTSKDRSSSSTESLKNILVDAPTHHPDPLVKQLEGDADLALFYRCFRKSAQSRHLHLEVLPSQGNGGLKWLQVRQKYFHIDPELGPVIVARILVSSNRVIKFQIVFPTYKTVYTKLFVEDEVESILSELSEDHVICPGLPGYKDKYTVLGYHPSHVRILETSHLQRYDHEHCPIWHVPSGTFSKRDRTVQNMCKQCKYLQNSVVRLATKACAVDPAERESWTDPSSNRPLAYMSAADREERYRKLRQERNQMLVKLRSYEERLAIGEVYRVSEEFSLSDL